MKVGAEPKKIAILGGLAAVAGYLLYANFFSGSGGAPPAAGRPAPPPAVASQQATTVRSQPAPAPARVARGASDEFRPSLKPRRGEDRPDPMSVDPTLRLDLLAKLQEVKLDGGDRSLFEFSQPPAPKIPEPKIIPKPVAKTPDEVKEPEKKDVKPPKPPPPPIPLKFYGFISNPASAAKRAFFLEGEDIFVAREGEVVKNRYKIVRIGVNSAVVEDTQHEHQQTLRLEEPQPG